MPFVETYYDPKWISEKPMRVLIDDISKSIAWRLLKKRDYKTIRRVKIIWKPNPEKSINMPKIFIKIPSGHFNKDANCPSKVLELIKFDLRKNPAIKSLPEDSVILKAVWEDSHVLKY